MEVKEETQPLPKWMMRRYALLWQSFKSDRFTLDDCMNQIKEEKQILLVLLSRLRKMGWLDVEPNEEDARKRLYSLKPIETVMARITL